MWLKNIGASRYIIVMVDDGNDVEPCLIFRLNDDGLGPELVKEVSLWLLIIDWSLCCKVKAGVMGSLLLHEGYNNYCPRKYCDDALQLSLLDINILLFCVSTISGFLRERLGRVRWRYTQWTAVESLVENISI